MRKESTGSRSESRPELEQLEDWVRSQVQRLIQELLEEDLTAFLGRAKSALRSDSDSDTGYRNGYGRARRLTLSSGTIQLRRPRVRDTEEQFESRLLPLIRQQGPGRLLSWIPELYLHGLSEGDFDLALRGQCWERTHRYRRARVARLKSKWNDELAQWRSRPLDDLEVVYMWVDGVYVKAGLEKEKAAVLVVMAALSDGSKVVVSTVPGYRESTESWSEVLRDIKRRGLSCPRLVVGDGHLGIWGALRNVYLAGSTEQRCWNHKIVNVLAKLPKRQQDQAKLMLRTLPYAPTRTEAERLRTVFTRWCGDHSYEAASEALERDWDRIGVEQIFARSPEAKGRVERANGTFQDRLVTELRLAGARTISEANQVLWASLDHAVNKRFGVPPAQSTNAYRSPDPDLNLAGILCFKHSRKVARDNTVKYNWHTLQLLPSSERSTYVGAHVVVQERLDGKLVVCYQNQIVPTQEAPPRPGVLRTLNATRGLGSVTVENLAAGMDTNGIGGHERERLGAMTAIGRGLAAGRLTTDRESEAVHPKAQPPRPPTPRQRARWKAVQRAKRRGLSLRAIARELGISRITVRKYVEASSPPVYPDRELAAHS